jgi:hypothetical protein
MHGFTAAKGHRKVRKVGKPINFRSFYSFLPIFVAFYQFFQLLPPCTLAFMSASVKAIQIFAFTAVIIGKSVKSCKMQVTGILKQINF